mmetsp:Transcript_23897/g.52705  ORF Transcript_23897/g.52705 Transcript_23897/m.52705 type:complete len:228 (-) Transcript_23897:223-906(-)
MWFTQFDTCCKAPGDNEIEVVAPQSVHGNPMITHSVGNDDSVAVSPAADNRASVAPIVTPDTTMTGTTGTDKVTNREMSDASTYTGGMLNNLRHGEGTSNWENSTYEGQWQADQLHGEGVQTWTDGRRYEGQFSQGRFHGNGKMCWTSRTGAQSVYEGQYVDDKKEGFGKFTWADGRSYEGQWSGGKRSGKGVYTSSSGRTRTGEWKDDKLVSETTPSSPDNIQAAG